MAFMYPSQSGHPFEHRNKCIQKPTLLTQTRITPSIPHGILVPNKSYLELFSEDDLQMRIG